MMRLFGLIAVQLCLVANTAFAGSLTKGDVVKLEYSASTEFGPNGGELFVWKQVSGGFEYVVKTFCVEFNEFFVPGGLYKIGEVSDRAVFGGVNNQTGDILDRTTKFLYDSFSNGTLASSGTGYVYGDANSTDALQKAIWSLEGERMLTGTGNDVLAQRLVSFATTQVASNPFRDYPVFVLNLFDISTPDALINAFNPLDMSTWTALQGYKKQDQLYYVPEPSTATIFALGLVLAGAARTRSRFCKVKVPTHQ